MLPRPSLLRPIAVVVGAALVTACGGGGGGATTASTIPPTTVGPTVGSGAASGATSVTSPAPEGIEGVVAVAATDPKNDQAHVAGKVTYATTPPTRGPHNAIWQNCGYYTKAVLDENAVHSLEHGAVWITYRPDADATVRAALVALAKKNPYLLITPYEANPAPIVLSAWGRQLRVDTIDDPRVARFVDTYAKTGPTVPEKGAACSGALGVPPDRPSTLAS